MKTRTIYECEFCGNQYKTPNEAYGCEATCLGLSEDEYKEYLGLLHEEKQAFASAANANNEQIRNRCDNAVNAVIEFQKKHGFVDNR